MIPNKTRPKMHKRNINLKGFLSSLLVVVLFGVGSFLLLGKWEQQTVVGTCQRFDVSMVLCCVLMETFAFFFSPSLSAMAHEHVHVRLWWSKRPDPRTY